MSKTQNYTAHPSYWTVAGAVGKVTFLEIVRDKVLYNIFLFALLLLGVGFLASRLTFVRPDRVILDFGISAINLSCAMIGILTGANLLGREFERRTIYVALSHPISRLEFVIGKFAGLSGVLVINWFLLCSLLFFILALNGGDPQSYFNATVLMAMILIFFQSLMITSIAILFSTVSTTSLAAIIAIGLYLIGNNISQIRLLSSRIQSDLASAVLNFVCIILPNLEYFNLGTKVTYGLPVSPQFGLTSVVYALVIISVALLISGFLVQSKEA